MGSHRYLAASGSKLWCWQPSSSSAYNNEHSAVDDYGNNNSDDDDNDDSNGDHHHSTISILPSSSSLHPTTTTTTTTTTTSNDEIANQTVSMNNPAVCNELLLVRDLHSVIWDTKMNCDQSSIITGSADGILRYVVH